MIPALCVTVELPRLGRLMELQEIHAQPEDTVKQVCFDCARLITVVNFTLTVMLFCQNADVQCDIISYQLVTFRLNQLFNSSKDSSVVCFVYRRNRCMKNVIILII